MLCLFGFIVIKKMHEWTNEETIHFLELYEAEPCIWNPENVDYKDKNKLTDAWNRISDALNVSVKDLKIKKDILMVTFRRHLRKKLDDIRSGLEVPYESVWYAYPTMERFLLPLYVKKMNKESEPTISLQQFFDDFVNDDDEIKKIVVDNNDQKPPATSRVSLNTSCNSLNKSKQKIHHRSSDLANQKMPTTIGQCKNGFKQCSPAPNAQDEIDLYAILFAKKLRELPEDERKIIMYEIDGLFVERIYKKRCIRETE